MSNINTLSASARSAIVNTFCAALESRDNTGSLVTQVCETASKYLKGENINKEDMESVTTDIARSRGWKGDAVRSRVSEVKVLLRAYATLPEAIGLYVKKESSCDWHTGMKLARRLNKGDSVAQSVKATIEQSSTQKKVSPQGRCAGALKAWYKISRADKRALIIKAAHLLNLEIGVEHA